MRKEKLKSSIDESQIELTESDNQECVNTLEEVERTEKELVTLFATIIVNHVLKDRYEKGNPLFKI